MTKRMAIYKCETCGNVVEILHEGKGHVICCGKPMRLYLPNTVETIAEKHIPVIERGEGELLVRVGKLEHPMEENHHIEWIEALSERKAYREYLTPGGPPRATFKIESDKVAARAYCNQHGLWKG